jgi:hypothetical protein
MAEIDRTNARDHDTPELEKANRASPSWLDGLPHNFDGWGPKTPDADAPDDMLPADSELTWTGEADDRHHHVWTFRRAGRRHH